MESESVYGTALYYPYIHVRKSACLKSSLLYWDRVRRIVPKQMYRPSGEPVEGDEHDPEILVAVKAKLLLNVSANDYVGEATGKFFSHVEPLLKDADTIDTLREAVQHSDEKMHIEKMGHQVLAKLSKYKLAKKEGKWVHMSDELSSLYMYCLASSIGQTIKAPLYTDWEPAVSLGETLLFSDHKNQKLTKSSHLVQLGIRMPAPAALEKVPMEKIVEFSHAHTIQRQSFRKAVEVILQTATTMEDPVERADYFLTQQDAIRGSVSEYRARIRALKLEAIQNVMTMEEPPLFKKLDKLVGWIFPKGKPLLKGLGIGVGAVTTIAATKGKLNEAARSGSYHYLTSLEDLGRRPTMFRR